jgi:hypothetical protein
LATRADEFEPPYEVVQRVIADGIRPILQACEEAVGGPFAATVTVWVGQSAGLSVEVLSSGKEAVALTIHAEVCLRFRRTINPSRMLFRAEAIFEGLSPDTAFSGFRLGGAARSEPEGVRVQPSGGTYCYNVRDWQGWR